MNSPTKQNCPVGLPWAVYGCLATCLINDFLYIDLARPGSYSPVNHHATHALLQPKSSNHSSAQMFIRII